MRRRAFTLVEMLVVISIIAIGSVLLVPAFGRLLESINYAAAVNSVSATLGNARALAIRDQRHTGVAFLFDVEREVCSLQVLVEDQAGSLVECDSVLAVALRPATNQVPIELPKGFAVYGLSVDSDCFLGPVNPIEDTTCEFVENNDQTCYDSGLTTNWYSGWWQETGINNVYRPLWLFPMNDARNYTENNPPSSRFVGVDPWAVLRQDPPSGSSVSEDEAERAVRHAQSFAVFFSPTGSVVRTIRLGEEPVGDMYIEWPTAPGDRSDPTLDPYDWPDRFDPQNDGSDAIDQPSPTDRTPNPEVFLRSVDQLAVVDLTNLGRALGVQRVWYVRPLENAAPKPEWLDELGYFDDDTDDDPKHRLVSRWIDENAEVMSFDRFSGKLIR